jgi:hypothetical protein
MIDENSLSKIIDKSIDPDGLKHCLGISVEENGEVDWGSFYGLEENCCVSLGIKDLGTGKLIPEEIAKTLNAYNIPAVSINGEYDSAKILVTDTGIKLPLQKPENAIEEISDIVNVLKVNNINIQGYAHPVTKDGLTKSTSERNKRFDCSKFDDIEIKEILDRRQTTFDEFVGAQLEEAVSKAMSSEKIGDMVRSNYMQSLYRGGTLGNQPYATVAARECKDFVYATPDFYATNLYAEGFGTHYKRVKGHRYGFIYEYEIQPNQKFTEDFGIEEGEDKHNAETLKLEGKIAYETAIYPHQNKLKGIYLSVDGQIYQIANQNGYISKEWEDFANLHPTKSMPSNQSEITRNNEMYQLSGQGKTASEYSGKTYNLTQQSLDSYIKEQMSADAVSMDNNGKLVTSYPLILKDIPDGADLSGLESCYLLENVTIGNNVKLPEVVSISGTVPDGVDLSNCKSLELHDITNIGKDVKLPEVVSISGTVPDGVDLSNCKSLELHDITNIGNDVKLPEVVSISGTIAEGVDLSSVKEIRLGSEVNFGKDVKLPETVILPPDMKVGGHIPDGADLSSAKEIRLGSEVNFGKDVKLPKTVILPPDMKVGGHIPDGVDLSNCKTLKLHDVTNIGKDVKLPEVVSISGIVTNGVDLSSAKEVRLGSEVNFGYGVRLPKTVILPSDMKGGRYIPDGTDLSKIENLCISGEVTFGKDVKLPKNIEFDKAKLSGHIPDGAKLGRSATLTGDVWLGKDCQYGKCIDQDNPPRIHGYVEYNYQLEKADFSKAESLTFTKDSSAEITKDFIFPENGNVKIEGMVSVDCPETIHKISKYDVNDCIVVCENNTANPIRSLPDNVNILISDENNKLIAIAKNAEDKKRLQEMCEARFSENNLAPEVLYLTQEEAKQQLGMQFTKTRSLKRKQIRDIARIVATINRLRGISGPKPSYNVLSEGRAVPIQTKAEPTQTKAEPTQTKAEPTQTKAEPTQTKATQQNKSISQEDIARIYELSGRSGSKPSYNVPSEDRVVQTQTKTGPTQTQVPQQSLLQMKIAQRESNGM